MSYICVKHCYMENGNEMENRIIKAAKDVFLDKGYEGTNMSLIAEAAGIARPALYYYYRSKDRIYAAVFGSILYSFIPSVIDVLNSDEAVDKRIDKFVSLYFEQIKREPRLPLFLVREIQRDPEFLLKTALNENADKVLKEFMAFYKREREKGTIKELPPYSMIFTFLGQIFFPFLARPLFEKVFPEQDFGEIIEGWKHYVSNSIKNLLLFK